MKDSLNYFNCTLGEAASKNAKNPPPWTTINALIEHQATENGSRPAVGFCDDRGDKWTHVVYSLYTSKLPDYDPNGDQLSSN